MKYIGEMSRGFKGVVKKTANYDYLRRNSPTSPAPEKNKQINQSTQQRSSSRLYNYCHSPPYKNCTPKSGHGTLKIIQWRSFEVYKRDQNYGSANNVDRKKLESNKSNKSINQSTAWTRAKHQTSYENGKPKFDQHLPFRGDIKWIQWLA